MGVGGVQSNLDASIGDALHNGSCSCNDSIFFLLLCVPVYGDDYNLWCTSWLVGALCVCVGVCINPFLILLGRGRLFVAVLVWVVLDALGTELQCNILC